MHRQGHRNLELVGEPAYPRQGGVVQCVRRFEREVRGYQRVATVVVPQRHAFFDVLIGIGRPARRLLFHHESDTHPDVRVGRCACDHLGPELHVGEARDAAAQHFRDREFRAVAHVLRVDPAPFDRRDRILEPRRQRQILCPAAQQRHGRMRVRIDQSRQDRVLRTLDEFGRRVGGERFGGRQHGDDASRAHRDRMVSEHGAVGFDGQHPAGANERVNRLHSGSRGSGHAVYRAQPGRDLP